MFLWLCCKQCSYTQGVIFYGLGRHQKVHFKGCTGVLTGCIIMNPHAPPPPPPREATVCSTNVMYTIVTNVYSILDLCICYTSVTIDWHWIVSNRIVLIIKRYIKHIPYSIPHSVPFRIPLFTSYLYCMSNKNTSSD